MPTYTRDRGSHLVHFADGIARDQLWFEQAGRDLLVSVIGTQDSVRVENWFAGSQYQVEQFRTADGAALLASQVQNLVNAMASFVPPSPGETTLPEFYSSQLAPTIVANWS